MTNNLHRLVTCLLCISIPFSIKGQTFGCHTSTHLLSEFENHTEKQKGSSNLYGYNKIFFASLLTGLHDLDIENCEVVETIDLYVFYQAMNMDKFTYSSIRRIDGTYAFYYCSNDKCDFLGSSSRNCIGESITLINQLSRGYYSSDYLAHISLSGTGEIAYYDVNRKIDLFRYMDLLSLFSTVLQGE